MENNIQKKLLFICSTREFTNYTRRATIEAISDLSFDSKCICAMSFWSLKKINISSKKIETIPYFYFIPYLFLKVKLLNKLNFVLNNITFNYKLNNYDIVVFSTPHQNIFNAFLKRQKKVLILSDPFHLMGYSYEDTRRIIHCADVILSTSMQLKNKYILKYFNCENANVKYWPNCVDSEVWKYNTYTRKVNFNEPNKVKIGFAGNFMEVTDIELLQFLVNQFSEFEFILAGINKYKKNTYEYNLFKEIISKKNVIYKGYIPYENLSKVIAEWDICLMIDKIDELSSYHHHNKMYQYLSQGKPVVYQKNHNDYERLEDVTFPSESKHEFLNNIKKVIYLISKDKYEPSKAISLSNKNTSTMRAIDFFKYL